MAKSSRAHSLLGVIQLYLATAKVTALPCPMRGHRSCSAWPVPCSLESKEAEACVIGLGTGTSAGWLAEVEAIKSVDVYELEPKIKNWRGNLQRHQFGCIEQPQDSIDLWRRLEKLSERIPRLTTSLPQSLPTLSGLVSPTSTPESFTNPSPRGSIPSVFTQWLQAYEIDTASVRSILTTLNHIQKGRSLSNPELRSRFPLQHG